MWMRLPAVVLRRAVAAASEVVEVDLLRVQPEFQELLVYS